MFCKPPHPPMHPVYIVIFRGDDTDFTGNQEILVKIHTERDISGCKAYFKYMGNVQTFDEIPEDKELHLVFSREQTKDMPLGTWDAELYLIDEQGRRMTVNNRIHMLVTNSVHEAYFPDDPQAVTVVINANEYVKDAEVSQDGKTLTLTKRDGTTVEFRGGGGSGGTDDYNDLENKPSVNGKTLQGDVLLSGNDIPVEDEESMSVTSAINETNVELNVHKDDKDNPHEVTAGQVGTYTASEIDDKINRFSAHYLTYDADGNPFATDTELTSAEQFYYAGELFTPTKNDYCVVLSDSGHDGKTTRYAFVGEWGEGGFWQYQYTINDTAFSQAQWAAINSGATTEKIAEIAEKADEFTEWVTVNVPEGVTVVEGPKWFELDGKWKMSTSDGLLWYGISEAEDAIFIQWYTEAPPYAPRSTRRRVLRTGDADKLTDAQKAVLDSLRMEYDGTLYNDSGFSSNGMICDASGVQFANGGLDYDEDVDTSLGKLDIRMPGGVKVNGKEVATEEQVTAVSDKVDEIKDTVSTDNRFLVNGTTAAIQTRTDETAEWTDEIRVDKGYDALQGDAMVKLDKSVQTVTVSGGTLTVELPDAVEGTVRDLCLYVNNTTSASEVTITFPTGITVYKSKGGDNPKMNAQAGGITAYYFTEIPSGAWRVMRDELEVAT